MIDKINEIIAKPWAQQALFFNEMLTPSLIRLAYWLCLVAVLGTGLDRMFSNGLSGFIGGIVFIAVGAILARVGAELIILFFKINENMETVANNSQSAAANNRSTAANNQSAAPVKKVAKKTSKKVTKKA